MFIDIVHNDIIHSGSIPKTQSGHLNPKGILLMTLCKTSALRAQTGGTRLLARREQLNFNPQKPICGVLSIAIIANCTFEKATEVVKKHMLPHQKRHGGKTYHEQRKNALKELGVNFTELRPYGTAQRWISENRPGYFMITTTSHVITVLDGYVCDQTQVCHYSEMLGGRCRVKHVLRVEGRCPQ